MTKKDRDLVNLIIERPKTPPAQIRDKQVIENPRRAIIQPWIVTVDPTNVYQQPQYSFATETVGYVQPQQQTLSYPQVYPQVASKPLYQTPLMYTYPSSRYPSYFAHTAGFPTPYGARIF